MESSVICSSSRSPPAPWVKITPVLLVFFLQMGETRTARTVFSLPMSIVFCSSTGNTGASSSAAAAALGFGDFGMVQIKCPQQTLAQKLNFESKPGRTNREQKKSTNTQHCTPTFCNFSVQEKFRSRVVARTVHGAYQNKCMESV
eukprot:scpid27857/ scgid1567/ 